MTLAYLGGGRLNTVTSITSALSLPSGSSSQLSNPASQTSLTSSTNSFYQAHNPTLGDTRNESWQMKPKIGTHRLSTPHEIAREIPLQYVKENLPVRDDNSRLCRICGRHWPQRKFPMNNTRARQHLATHHIDEYFTWRSRHPEAYEPKAR